LALLASAYRQWKNSLDGRFSGQAIAALQEGRSLGYGLQGNTQNCQMFYWR